MAGNIRFRTQNPPVPNYQQKPIQEKILHSGRGHDTQNKRANQPTPANTRTHTRRERSRQRSSTRGTAGEVLIDCGPSTRERADELENTRKLVKGKLKKLVVGT